MEAQGKLGGGAALVQESDAMLRSIFLPGQANLPAHPQANHLHQPQFDVQNRQAPAAEQHVQAPGFQDFAADIVPKYQELDVKYNNIMNQNPEVGSDASFELRDKA